MIWLSLFLSVQVRNIHLATGIFVLKSSDKPGWPEVVWMPPHGWPGCNYSQRQKNCNRCWAPYSSSFLVFMLRHSAFQNSWNFKNLSIFHRVSAVFLKVRLQKNPDIFYCSKTWFPTKFEVLCKLWQVMFGVRWLWIFDQQKFEGGPGGDFQDEISNFHFEFHAQMSNVMKLTQINMAEKIVTLENCMLIKFSQEWSL